MPETENAPDLRRLRPGFLRKYGFGFILLALFLASIFAFAGTNESEVRHDAKTECEIKSLVMSGGQDENLLDYRECIDPNEVDDRFWNGVWENLQSEWAQLLVQFLGMVAFAGWVTYKAQQDTDEIKALLREMRESGTTRGAP